MVNEYLLLRGLVALSGHADLITAMRKHELERFGGNSPDLWQGQSSDGGEDGI